MKSTSRPKEGSGSLWAAKPWNHRSRRAMLAREQLEFLSEAISLAPVPGVKPPALEEYPDYLRKYADQYIDSRYRILAQTIASDRSILDSPEVPLYRQQIGAVLMRDTFTNEEFMAIAQSTQ